MDGHQQEKMVGGTQKKTKSQKQKKQVRQSNQMMLQFSQQESKGFVTEEEVVQSGRIEINIKPVDTISLNEIAHIYNTIQEQIEKISLEEVSYIDMENLVSWQGNYLKYKEMIDEIIPPDKRLPMGEIKNGNGPYKFVKGALAQISKLRKELNRSLEAILSNLALRQEAEADKLKYAAKIEKQEAKPVKKKEYIINESVEKAGGVVAYVEGNVVVIVEHYQLKHNRGMGELTKFGPFLGTYGSQLEGGWEAHCKIYAKEIYNHVKDNLSDLVGKTQNKERLGNIEAYIVVTEEAGTYFVAYHGNPPGK